jgi:Phosphotransferase enzyme family
VKRTVDIPVVDPFCAADDPEMPSIATALDPNEAQRQFEHRLGHLAGEDGSFRVREIRVARYKPGRRCVIEYDLDVEQPDAPPEAITLLGKVRVRRFGKSGYRLLSAFWNAGFDADAPDGICVPEPVGTVSKFRMWLQRKVQGHSATEVLAAPGGVKLARRIADAAHKIHRAGVPAERRHSMVDELRILHERLPVVRPAEPRWAERIERILEASDHLGAATPEPEPCGIHRDFYADQMLVDGSRLYLLDFDLYCEGDPALDIGNFLGHITEQSLRAFGDPEALAEIEEAAEERFVELSGEKTRSAVRAYKTLTLVRHIHLSTLFPERRPFTERLLALCEERLGVGC